MNLRGKSYVESQKKSFQAKLDARRALLKGKGLKDDEIQKDVTVRKLKADLRQSDVRLAAIAAQEKRNQDRAKATADKLAAGKVPKESKKKAKEEVPEKKEKKAKKEKKEKKPEQTEG